MVSSLQEQILVIQRALLFADQKPWHGIDNTQTDSIISKITMHQEFLERSLAETNFAYKQIIPYLVFSYQGTYFVMQRKETASEKRLAGKLSLGIGGHMRKEDIEGKTIFDWAQREFEEEVCYQGNLTIKTLGVLNDDTNEVGQVHIGLVLLLEGNTPNITIKNEHKSGVLFSKQACIDHYNDMESWSQLILKNLP